ncbi:hypothetical protein HK102_002626, partial [Quaeritorhiza haematococci]
MQPSVENRTAYLDESDIFYASPLKFLVDYFDVQVGNKTLDWKQLGEGPLSSISSSSSSSSGRVASSSTSATEEKTKKTKNESEHRSVPGQKYTIRMYRWPTHVVFFEGLEKLLVENVFVGSDYVQ